MGTSDDRERAAMTWWEGMSEAERADIARDAGTVLSTPSVAEAWNLRRAMDWWNALSKRERDALMRHADVELPTPSIAEVWNLRIEQRIDGPPLPAGAARIPVREREALRDFRCPCCGEFLGRTNPRLPGLTWCRGCQLEISTKPCPNPPIV